MLGVGSQRSQEEVDDEDDFLIQHLLQAQASPTPQAPPSHHQSSQQQGASQAQSVPSASDPGKGLSYEMSKSSEERYHLQSVIRTHSATSSAGAGTAGLDTQLEMSLKKQHQQHQDRKSTRLNSSH